MTFSNSQIRLPIVTLVIACVAFLSFPATIGIAKAKEVQTTSGKLLAYPDQKLEKIIALVYDKKIQDKIISVITHYKTGLKEEQMDQISQHILKQSKKYGYDPLFLTALIITESSFNHRAKSKVGALGLMQIRPKTGEALASEANMLWSGKSTLYHPEKNIALGSYYLNKLVKRFGKMHTALEAYNHGPTRIASYLRRGKHPKDYSGKVFSVYNKIRLAKADS